MTSPSPSTSTSPSPSPSPSSRPGSGPASSAPVLLGLARRGLHEAALTTVPGQRYALSHLAALRGAAAVLACRARPASPTRARRSRPTSAWTLLVGVAPELGEWAEFFAGGAPKRAAAEAGLPGVVTPREADDLLRDATSFLATVESLLARALLEAG